MKPRASRFGFLRLLDYVRYALAGGIAGIAVYNTYMLIASATPAQSMESIAMAAGAVFATGMAKVLHIV